MAEYIKREMPDLNRNGEKKCYYQVRNTGNLSNDEFLKRICHPSSGLDRGDVTKVLVSLINELKIWLADGYSVTIDELGTFSISIGLKDNIDVEDFDGNGKLVNARRLRVRNINFRPDKRLIKEIASRCELRKGYESPIHRSPFSKEQRLNLALKFIEENNILRVSDYEMMTFLPHASAARELREFSADPTIGITSNGKRNTIVYIKSH